MTPIFMVTVMLGWVVVSFVVCVAVCMASSRFSAQVVQHEVERESARMRQAQSKRARRPIPVRMESGAGGPMKVKRG